MIRDVPWKLLNATWWTCLTFFNRFWPFLKSQKLPWNVQKRWTVIVYKMNGLKRFAKSFHVPWIFSVIHSKEFRLERSVPDRFHECFCVFLTVFIRSLKTLRTTRNVGRWETFSQVMNHHNCICLLSKGHFHDDHWPNNNLIKNKDCNFCWNCSN